MLKRFLEDLLMVEVLKMQEKGHLRTMMAINGKQEKHNLELTISFLKKGLYGRFWSRPQWSNGGHSNDS